jgi:hypothetical protein
VEVAPTTGTLVVVAFLVLRTAQALDIRKQMASVVIGWAIRLE